MPLHPLAEKIIGNIQSVLLGKHETIALAFSALVADGHVLLEDVPGVGKTVLARALAISIGASFNRIQFTPDILPGDITGVPVFDPETRAFVFRAGPIFTQVLLADEINRASPRSQSALLESMDERRVTSDGNTYRLPAPFLVLATQNPVQFAGTYPLPESQMDRFMVSLQLGYPAREDELHMLQVQEMAHPIDHLAPVATIDALLAMQQERRQVYVDELVRDYILDLVTATRQHPDIRLGASPRATLALFAMAQATALVAGRTYVVPDDVQQVALPVLRHRLMPGPRTTDLDQTLSRITDRIPVPGNRG